MKLSVVFLLPLLPLLALASGRAADVNAAAQSQPTGLWADLYATDIATFAANLRNAGCPEATVGLLVSQEINVRFKDREAALQPSTDSVKSLQAQFSRERREALVQLQLEKNALLRSALGVLPEETARIDWTPGALQRLAPPDREVVRMITEDYNAMILRVVTESRGHLFDEDRAKLRFLETERSQDLSKLLSPDEILDLEFAATDFGRKVAAHLTYFAPTRERIRSFMTIAKKHDLDFDGSGPNVSRVVEEWQAVFADLAALWGPETYARYRKTTSLQYKQIYTLVRRLNLGPDDVDAIFASQKKTTEQELATFLKWRASLGSPSPPIPPTRTPMILVPTANARYAGFAKAMAPLLDEHLDLVRKHFGDTGYNEYFELNRAWIEAIENGGAVRLPYSD